MGAKRKIAVVDTSAEKQKKAKRNSDVQTEEAIALKKMLSAFDGAVGTMLSENVVAMVKEISEKCLLPPVENREPLETKFAEAVGAALDASMNGLAKAPKEAIDTVTDEEAKVQSLQD